MQIDRRKLMTAMTAFGVATALPGFARAEDVGTIWDSLWRRSRGKEATPDANTNAALALIDTPEPILSFDTAYNLQLAIERYRQIVSGGGWELPTRATFGLAIDKDNKAVAALKQQLSVAGDMPPAERQTQKFDNETDLALRKFQARHGIVPNGKVDEPTFYALAVPADRRLAQLELNALRVAQLAPTLEERYLLVNVPAASIETVESGAVASRHTAVVGKIDRQTPLVGSKVHQVKFNPYWTVPKSIIEKDLIRYVAEDPGYLNKYNIRIFDDAGNEVSQDLVDWTTTDAVRYTFRQDPGGENSMGHCKVDFYNPFDVYLHDTPTKALFGENSRFHSSGCVRVEGIDVVAAWLLRDNGGWDLEAVRAMFATNENVNVPLTHQVPIHTTYVTAWANRLGTVSFRDDIYEFDAQGKVTWEGA